MNEWHKIKQAPPPEHKDVLICDTRVPVTFVGSFSRNRTGELIISVRPFGNIIDRASDYLAWSEFNKCNL